MTGRRSPAPLALVLVLVTLAAAPARARPPVPFPPQTFGALETSRCLKCHGLPNFLYRDTLTAALRDLSVDSTAFLGSAHGKLACTQCHGEIHEYPHRFAGGTRPEVACSDDCHATDGRGAPLNHAQQVAEVTSSAHGRGLTGEDPDAPTCLSCHGGGRAHAIAKAKGALGKRAKLALCAECHEDRVRMARRRVDTEAVASYRRSFHYAALRYGAENTAVCQDCHTVHHVLSPDSLGSSVGAASLVRTCGQEKCHAGAKLNFALSGANHLALRARRAPALWLEERFFAALSLAVMAVLVAGVLLDLLRRLGLLRAGPAREPDRRARALREAATTLERAAPGPLVPRMDREPLLQHAALVVSFTLLALTGVPLRFPDFAPLGWLYRLVGGIEGARWIHRGAAVTMALAALWHLVYAGRLLTRERFAARRAWPMLPGTRDARDWGATVAFHLGRRALPPAHEHFEFRQKLHYLAVAWGVPIMVFSGLVLWFPVLLGNRLPDLAIGAAMIAHSDEALLAIGVVVVWHLFNVHLLPGAHHRFMTWLDGLVTAKYWVLHHGREVERVTGCPVSEDARQALLEEAWPATAPRTEEPGPRASGLGAAACPPGD